MGASESHAVMAEEIARLRARVAELEAGRDAEPELLRELRTLLRLRKERLPVAARYLARTVGLVEIPGHGLCLTPRGVRALLRVLASDTD